MSRENDRPREPWEEPAEEDSYEVDPEFRQRPRLPRSARPSMNRGSTPVDRSVHPRKRPRQGGDPRGTGNDRSDLYERHPKRRLDPSRADDPRRAYDAYGRPRQGRPSPGNRLPVDPEFEEFDRPALRPATRMLPSGLGGIIGSKSSFTKQVQQPLPISATTRQLQVHNRVGNLSIMVDSTATQATLSAVEKVQASSSSDANKEFGRISVNVKAGSDPSILTVNATVPDTSGGLLAGASDSVDMTIVLPSMVNKIPPSSFTISASVASTGDLSVQNFTGLLNLTGNMGNINVQDGYLTKGSCLQINRGNVTFNGFLIIGANSDVGRIPCTANTTQNPHPWFSIKSGVGNVDVTLGADTTVILDASTNSGKINGSDFNLPVQQNSDGSASYTGPLITGTSPTATLVLEVSTGNITLHKTA